MKNNNTFQRIFLAFFVAITLFWAGLYFTQTKEGNLNYWYSFLFGLIPLFGGVLGMFTSRMWGGLSSALGKAIFFISFGLFLWGFGESIWSYYNFFKDVPAPYPSLADIGFGPSIFFWILGTFYLSKASGAMFALKQHTWAKVLAILIPIILIVPSYYLQVVLARQGTLVPEGETTLKVILDIAYPLGDFLALVFAALVYGLSYKYFGGLYRKAMIYILSGLAIMYCGDSIFSYSTTKGTYYNADFGDLLLSVGLFLLTYGVVAFGTKPSTANKHSKTLKRK